MPVAAEFFVHYAYGILFLWVLVEQLGVPVPAAPLMLAAGTMTATHKISATATMTAILLACLVADSVWYYLGVRYGSKVVALICRLSLEAETCVRKTESTFGRHGSVTLLFAKFVPGLSTVATPIAGQTGMPYARFIVFDLLGSALWASAFVFGGRFFGDIAKRYSGFLHFLTRFGVLLFVLALLFLVARRIWRQRVFLRDLQNAGISPAELMDLINLAEDSDVKAPFIVDLRHPLDYLPDPRVLPGALRISPTELEKNCHLLPRDTDVILYCTCPNDATSVSMAKRLSRLGVTRVRPLLGGFEGWRDAHLPLNAYDEQTSREAAPELINATTMA